MQEKRRLGSDGLGRASWSFVPTITCFCSRSRLGLLGWYVAARFGVIRPAGLAFSVDFGFQRLRCCERVDVSAELDDLPQKIRRFALPVSHGFRCVRVTWRELGWVSKRLQTRTIATYSNEHRSPQLVMTGELVFDILYIVGQSSELIDLHEIACHHALCRWTPVR